MLRSVVKKLFNENVVMNLTFKINCLLTEISEKTCPLSLHFALENIFDGHQNQLLLIVTRAFRDCSEGLFASLERVANFMIISFIFFKFTNIKEIKFEDLQQIASFYHEVICESYRRRFVFLTAAKTELISEAQLRHALQVSRAQICEILIILHVQKDVKIPRLEQRLGDLFAWLVEKYPRADSGDAEHSRSSTSLHNTHSPLKHFSNIFENLAKKFHHENAYYANFAEFKMQVLPG